MPLQSHLGEEDQAAELEGFHSGCPALCWPGVLLCSPHAGWFCWGKGCSRGLVALLLGDSPAAPRQQLCWWQDVLQICWSGAALLSPPGSHLELEQTGTGFCLIQLHGGSMPIRYKHAWEQVSFCGPSEHCKQVCGECEHAPGCPGHYMTLKTEFGSRR